MPTSGRATVVPALLAAALSVDAAAQSYPQRPIQLVVATAPSGGTDAVGRLIGQKLSDALAQNVVIDNRPGASGSIGTALVAKAVPDGYTLLVANVGHVAMNPAIARVPFDTLRDFAPVSQIASGPLILLAHPLVPVRTVRDVIALAKANPGKLNYATGGSGTTSHFGMELFKSMTGTDIVHIAFKGIAPATISLIAGEVDLMFNTTPPALPQVRAGKLKAIAMASLKRTNFASELPTLAESGVPGFEAGVWYGILAPAGTAPNIIARLNSEIVRIVRLPDVQQRLALEGVEAVGNSPGEFGAYIKSELAKYATLARRANIRAD
jgi:tripartite-type tricarboxylate transporter receptor subunit TctC